MLGHKVREFKPLTAVSLEDPVPEDNFFRQLDQALDLSFILDGDTIAGCSYSNTDLGRRFHTCWTGDFRVETTAEFLKQTDTVSQGGKDEKE